MSDNSEEMRDLVVKNLARILDTQNSDCSQDEILKTLKYLCNHKAHLKIKALGRSVCRICNKIITKDYTNLNCECYQTVHISCLQKQLLCNSSFSCFTCGEKINEKLIRKYFGSEISPKSEMNKKGIGNIQKNYEESPSDKSDKGNKDPNESQEFTSECSSSIFDFQEKINQRIQISYKDPKKCDQDDIGPSFEIQNQKDPINFGDSKNFEKNPDEEQKSNIHDSLKYERKKEEKEVEELKNEKNVGEIAEFKFDDSLDGKCLEKAEGIKKFKEIQSQKLAEDLNTLMNSFKERKLLLILIGETSAGKTTLINRILSYNIKTNSFDKAFYNLLPSMADENTAFLWLIECGDDEEFIWVESSSNERRKFHVSDSNSLKTYLNEIDSQQTALVKQSMKKSNKAEFLKKRITLTIRLPWLDPKLKILDFPGLSSETVLSDLQQFIRNNIAYFIYVKDLSTSQILIENFMKLGEDFSRKNINNDLDPTFFSLVFTKKDQFFFESKADQDHYEKSVGEFYDYKINRLIDILNVTEDFLRENKINIKRVDFMNLLKLANDPNEREFFHNFISHLQSIEKSILYHKRSLYFLSNLMVTIDTHFQEKLKEAKALIDLPTALKISALLKTDKYAKKIDKFFRHIKDFKSCKKKENEFFEKIKSLIVERIKIESKKKMQWNKNNFLQLIFKLCNQEIMNILLQKFQSIFRAIFLKVLQKIINLIGEEKFEDILNVRLEIDGNVKYNWDLQEKHTLINLILCTLLTNYRMATISIIPISGWILAFSCLATTALFAFKDNIGLFSIKNCWVLIMESILQFIAEKKNEIKDNLMEEAEALFQNIIDKITSYKELPKEILKYKRTILELRESLKEQENEVLIDRGDSMDIWKKVRIEQLLFDDYLKEQLPKKSVFATVAQINV